MKKLLLNTILITAIVLHIKSYPLNLKGFYLKYYYYTGGMPAEKYVTINIVITNKKLKITRKETYVHNRNRKLRKNFIFNLSSGEVKNFINSLIKYKYFYILTERTRILDRFSETIKIKINGNKYFFGETPIITIIGKKNKIRYSNIIKLIYNLIKSKLPDDLKWILNK